jgi:hypothetical protein
LLFYAIRYAQQCEAAMSQAPIFPTKATPARMMDSLEIKFKVAVENHQIPSFAGIPRNLGYG